MPVRWHLTYKENARCLKTTREPPPLGVIHGIYPFLFFNWAKVIKKPPVLDWGLVGEVKNE